jgi:hypothetical protein
MESPNRRCVFVSSAQINNTKFLRVVSRTELFRAVVLTQRMPKKTIVAASSLGVVEPYEVLMKPSMFAYGEAQEMFAAGDGA